MLFQTTQAHEELRSRIRAFAEEEIKPIAFMLDQNNEFPTEAVKKLGELGWMGIPFPVEYGGMGGDALSYAIAVEELARVDGGCRLNRDLETVSLYDLLSIIEGGYEVNACMDPDFTCPRRERGGCSVHPQLLAIQKTLTDQLRSHSLQNILTGR